MLESKVLVFELGAVDALPACSIASSEITALDHELLDDAVEGAALVAEELAGLAFTLLAGAEGAEVVCGLGDYIVVQLEGDAAFLLGADCDVEVDTAALIFFCHCGS
jgi:hypothetical protein